MKSDSHRWEKVNPIEIEKEALPLMDWLYNMAYYVSADKRAAKKLIKRTFKKVLEYYDKTRGGENYKAWTLRIMLNRIYEFYSKQRESEKGKLDSEFLFNIIDLNVNEIMNLSESIKNSINSKRILTAIKSMPIDLRLPLIFQNILKYNYELSAEYIDIPEGTVASRIFRARKWIFTELASVQIPISTKSKLLCRDMKLLASEADSEIIKDENFKLDAYTAELDIQKNIKSILQEQLIEVKSPRLIKSKFSRKVRKMIRKFGKEG